MNLVNLENVTLAYGASPLLDQVSLGVGEGERVGIVGRNGDGKTTLVSVLAGEREPDAGRVTHARGLRCGFLDQRDTLDGKASVRELVVGDLAEHEWASDPRTRDVLRGLLGGFDLETLVGTMSGGERRRVALARLLTGEHDLLILDEPTNHLDIEAIDWLGRHLAARRCAMLVVTHDRWFLDAVSTHTWEVEGGQVHRYEGGYSAYVLARAERERLAAAAEERRRNLARKELAWLQRGPKARTSKPKFRVEAANALIANEPPPRDTVELTRFATARLGKTVYELEDVTAHAGDQTLFDGLTWQLGPGDRVGLVGVNGSGKTSLLRLLTGELAPSSGRVKAGKTVQVAHLPQEIAELDPTERALESVQAIRRVLAVGKKEYSANQLMERFGFRGDRQWTLNRDLSGGERRRLQLLRLLMSEPNVLLLDEPTNDLDIETLTELEDLLDSWPGSLMVVSHDRYFLERVTDKIVAVLGDGGLSMLPGGVDEYLRRHRHDDAEPAELASGQGGDQQSGNGHGGRQRSAAETRTAQKELARLERRLDKIERREGELHAAMAEHASDYEKLIELETELTQLRKEKDELEESWLEHAEHG